MSITKDIRKKLEALADPKYQTFASKLIPNCNNLIGVRLPKLKLIAKQIINNNQTYYLQETNEIYFEEIMLKGLIIGYLKTNLQTLLIHIKTFIPKINNWSICDSFCSNLKEIKNYKKEIWDLLPIYYNSNKEFEIRTAIVIMLNYFISPNYINQIFSIFDNITQNDYYVQMAIAWAIATCYTKFPTETMNYLKTTNLNIATYNKALQKIRESKTTTNTEKQLLLTMKKKPL